MLWNCNIFSDPPLSVLPPSECAFFSVPGPRGGLPVRARIRTLFFSPTEDSEGRSHPNSSSPHRTPYSLTKLSGSLDSELLLSRLRFLTRNDPATVSARLSRLCSSTNRRKSSLSKRLSERSRSFLSPFDP